MSEVVAELSMSLDGFVAGPDDRMDDVFRWCFAGDVEIPVQGGRMAFNVAPQSAEVIKDQMEQFGAMVAGRRTFELARGWNGNPPYPPCFVLTHDPPDEGVKDGAPITFVTAGVEDAIQLAKTAAGTKDVAVISPSVVQQCLTAGLLDAIHINLAPCILGEGVRLFDRVGAEAVALAIRSTVAAPDVVHLDLRVVRQR